MNNTTTFILLTARKNLDQPIGDPKNTFIKFNEQISGKYRAGLSIKYLNDYLGDSIVPKTIADFYSLNVNKTKTDRNDFEKILKSKTSKDTDWFFKTVVSTRDLIDFKFSDVKRAKRLSKNNNKKQNRHECTNFIIWTE